MRRFGTRWVETRRRKHRSSASFEKFCSPAPRATLSAEEQARRLRFAMKAQQYTGPVQAKGVEDTAFYRDRPLLSLNEVGGNPTRFGVSAEDFHNANRERSELYPLAMSATSTHDAKRGEDARARLNILSEIPKIWDQKVKLWMRINSSARTSVDDEPAPDRSDEYIYYQALLGAWPAGRCKLLPSLSAHERRFVKGHQGEENSH